MDIDDMLFFDSRGILKLDKRLPASAYYHNSYCLWLTNCSFSVNVNCRL